MISDPSETWYLGNTRLDFVWKPARVLSATRVAAVMTFRTVHIFAFLSCKIGMGSQSAALINNERA